MDLSKFTEVTNEETKRAVREFISQFGYSVPGPVVARVVRCEGDPDGTMRAVLRCAHSMQRDPLDDLLFDPFVNQGGKPS